ncbi:MAG: dehydrogenase, partial [Verrucomicrobia bacterium]|nr:dehydrogenase [Verrucomicrobiota bacterium]
MYPFPAGLKILKYDEYLRAVFDKVPEPPPNGTRGLDKITILEDKDGDGVYETQKDFVTGLNIATSVLPGHDGVWVLNPPYLLFYPDKNHDDVPDGDPEVRLSGFGLEDTHATANSLTWGPDGWLYGAQGSTTTSNVNGIHFLGQAIWRYHPETRVFEIFAEGGGNTYSLEFDSQGRAFSGTNAGNTRGLHYVQGGAYVKNWAKHGPLLNPYSFGWFEHMPSEGFKSRFAQSMVVYEGGALPGLEGQLIASMSLVNLVKSSRLIPDTSTYRTQDTASLVETDDRWFRPVDTKVAPDGSVIFADWYDARLTHVDPRDTWDHERGRIYRMKAQGAKPLAPFNLEVASNDELLRALEHPNKWFRQTACRVIGQRRDATLFPRLREMVGKEGGQLALEALWALNWSGGFNEKFALDYLNHPNPSVRTWIVRLLGDTKQLAADLRPAMQALARSEMDVQVRTQLACSAKRWPVEVALPLVRALLEHHEDVSDKHQPLLLWWALERQVAEGKGQLRFWLKSSALWQNPIFKSHLISRLGQRCTAERSDEGLVMAASLFELATEPEQVDLLVRGMDAGLQGDMVRSVPEAMRKRLASLWSNRPHTPELISLAMRLGYEPAAAAAGEQLADRSTPEKNRKLFLALLGERRVKTAVPLFLKLLREERSESLRLELLNTLQRFAEEGIVQTVLDLYPEMSPKLRAAAVGMLSSRVEWALPLLEAVEAGHVKKEQVPPTALLTIQGFNNSRCEALISKQWGRLRQSSAEKDRKMADVRKLLASGAGDLAEGRKVFQMVCSTCHTLNGEGGKIGPELTGYERDNLDFMIPAIVDPSLGIREEYTTFNVTTKDGQVLVGFILENTPQAVTFQDIGTVDSDPSLLRVSAPNAHTRDRILSRYMPLVREALEELGAGHVNFVVDVQAAEPEPETSWTPEPVRETAPAPTSGSS